GHRQAVPPVVSGWDQWWLNGMIRGGTATKGDAMASKNDLAPISTWIEGEECLISTDSADGELWRGKFLFRRLDLRGEVEGLGSRKEAVEAAQQRARAVLLEYGL